MTDDLVRLRRAFHAHAELAFSEVWTAAAIRAELATIAGRPGVTIRTGSEVLDTGAARRYPDEAAMAQAVDRAVAAGADPDLARQVAIDGTAVVVDIQGDRPGPVIAFRSDIDALPIDESGEAEHLPAREGFTSVWPTMHACGHDGHTALGVVLALRLAADRDFAGTARIIFQPAEENVRGAEPMIAAGVAEDIDIMIGLHLGEGLPAGDLAGGSHGLQATEKFDISYTGVAAHAAASPQHGRNALAAAAQATLGLLAMSRDSRGTTNVNVGKLVGGRQSNIVPDHAVLSAEVRSDVAEVCAEMVARAGAVAAGAATAWQVSHEIETYGRATTLTCDSELVGHVAAVASGVDGRGTVHESVLMSASDDMSLWAAAVQQRGGLATFAVAGASSPAPHHHPRFDVDESVLPVACDWMERCIRTMPPGLGRS